MRYNQIIFPNILKFGIFFLACCLQLHASESHFQKESEGKNTTKKIIHQIGFNFGIDYAAPSVGDEVREKIPAGKLIKTYSSVPVNLRYSFSFTNPKIPHYLPGGYQGIGVGILNLGGLQTHGIKNASNNIGYPVLAYIFQGGPAIKINKNLSLNYEWNFGASFGWKPYGKANKYFNLTVGSRVNAYLNIGFYANWRLNGNYCIFGGVSVSHFSNGNTSFPNPGINSFGVRIGLVYTINPVEYNIARAIKDTVKKKKVEFDIMAWGATRKRLYRGLDPPVLLPGHFACAGISFAPMYRFNSWWRVGGSLDLQWDRSSDMKRNYISGTKTDDIQFETPSVIRQTSIGISIHGELQMPIFAVNLGCGYNLLAPWENRGSYQNISLKTYVGEKFFINVGYQLRNFQQQSNLMLGCGLSI